MPTFESLTVNISIERDWREAYGFAHVPGNFVRWASGLASGLERIGEEWVAHGPAGRVRIRFAPPNDFGVLDHEVITEDGTTVDCPLRMVRNGSGCEVMFTLFRRPGMDEASFAADAAWVKRDLLMLKGLLETSAQTAG